MTNPDLAERLPDFERDLERDGERERLLALPRELLERTEPASEPEKLLASESDIMLFF